LSVGDHCWFKGRSRDKGPASRDKMGIIIIIIIIIITITTVMVVSVT
jgi:flagellar basal body-associated protein FliL